MSDNIYGPLTKPEAIAAVRAKVQAAREAITKAATDPTDFVPTISLTMGFEQVRANPYYDAPDALRQYIGKHELAIALAPAVIFHRRYLGGAEDSTHRIIGVTLDLASPTISEATQGKVEYAWYHLLRGNYRLRSYGWNDLAPELRLRLLRSSILPLEFKSEEFMAADDPENFQIVMSDKVKGALL